MSGIYIPGVEIPRCCMDCHYHKSLRDQCILTHRDQRDLWSRPDWCPIVPVPPHGDLFDFNFCMENYELLHDDDGNPVYAVRMKDIVNAPTIIPADPAEEGE